MVRRYAGALTDAPDTAGLFATQMDAGASGAFVLYPDWGDELIIGGPNGQNWDVLDLSRITALLHLAFDGPGMGTVTDPVNGDSLVFSGIKRIDLGPRVEIAEADRDNGATLLRPTARSRGARSPNPGQYPQ